MGDLMRDALLIGLLVVLGAAGGGVAGALRSSAAAGDAPPAAAATARPATPAVTPATPARRPADPCATNHAAQLVIVSIPAQRMWLCTRSTVHREYPVTTGRDAPGTRTPTGEFTVQGRDTDTVLHPDDGGAYHVDYWIPFEAPDYGFHDASWETTGYGTDAWRAHGSHGCVHMPHAAIAYFYRWVHVGTAVRIR
jgi:hypothetical protein